MQELKRANLILAKLFIFSTQKTFLQANKNLAELLEKTLKVGELYEHVDTEE